MGFQLFGPQDAHVKLGVLALKWPFFMRDDDTSNNFSPFDSVDMESLALFCFVLPCLILNSWCAVEV